MSTREAPDPAGTQAQPERQTRDDITDLFARALDNDDAAAGAAFRDLVDLAYAGDPRAELAYQAILTVEVERAEAACTMPTEAQFEAILDRAWAAHPAGRDTPFPDGRNGPGGRGPTVDVAFGEEIDGSHFP